MKGIVLPDCTARAERGYGGLLGESSPMQELYGQISKASHAQSSVLIQVRAGRERTWLPASFTNVARGRRVRSFR